MTWTQQFTVGLTNDTAGAASSNSTIMTGRIASIIYTSTSASTAQDITISTVDSGQSVWAESNVTAPATRNPVQATHTTTGAALQLSTTGGPGTVSPIYVGNETLSVAVSGGTSGTTCSFRIFIA